MAVHKSLSSVRLIITDWSGVMSDDRLPVYESNARMMVEYKLMRPTFEEWLPMTKLSAEDFFAQFDIVEAPGVINNRYKALYETVRSEGIHPVVYSDAVQFVRLMQVRNKPMTVVSSHPEVHLRAEAKEYELESYVRYFIGSAGKKSDEIERTLTKFGVHASDAVYMGDTIYDIQEAKKAGVISIGVASGYHTADRLATAEPYLLVNSLSELKRYF